MKFIYTFIFVMLISIILSKIRVFVNKEGTTIQQAQKVCSKHTSLNLTTNIIVVNPNYYECNIEEIKTDFPLHCVKVFNKDSYVFYYHLLHSKDSHDVDVEGYSCSWDDSSNAHIEQTI